MEHLEIQIALCGAKCLSTKGTHNEHNGPWAGSPGI